MTEFQGILINESKLLYLYWFVIVVSLVMAVIILWLAFSLIREKVCRSTIEVKAEQRIKNLKEKAKENPSVQKELDRRLRRHKQHSKSKNRTIWEQALLLSLMLIALIVLLYCSRSYLQDYNKKDYVIYNGSFEYINSSYARYGTGKDIYLPDGTSLSGAPDSWNVNGTYSGTLVYAKRSGLVLGIELNEKASP